jgi:transposase
MDTSSREVIESASAEALGPEKRQYRSPELKRKIVEESLAPGASVARIALAHGVNANLVFTWRRRYRQGTLQGGTERPGLLAVRVAEAAGDTAGSGSLLAAPAASGTIQIELAKGTVRIRGSADLGALRTALEILAR